MPFRFVRAALLALPLMIVAGGGSNGADETYPELLGGPDSAPTPAKPERGKPKPETEVPAGDDLAAKPWRAIDVDNPAPVKATKPRKAKAPEPRVRDALPRKPKKVARKPAAKTPRPAKSLPSVPDAGCAEPRYLIEVERVMLEPERVAVRMRAPRYDTVRQRVEVRPAQDGTLVYPAQYRTVREKVLVRSAQRRLVRIPARYSEELRRVAVTGPRRGWVLERVGKRNIWVPATLPPATRVQLVRIPVAPAHTAVVDEPAVYETRTRRVLVSAERRERVSFAPEYKTVTRKVLVEPARQERVVVPARYETVRRRVATGNCRP